LSTSSWERREKSSASKNRRTCVPRYPLPPVTRTFKFQVSSFKFQVPSSRF